MTKSESYDPLTWRDGLDYSSVEDQYTPLAKGRASRVGLALSAILLLGGAALAYGTAEHRPAASTEQVGN